MNKNELINFLIETNCLKQGIFKLKSGDMSKYYFNLKNLISYPDKLCLFAEELFKKLPEFDIICGIPYGGLPIATYISIKYNKPMIIIRDQKKSYGMESLIEGEYSNDSKCVLIDDVLTSGGSINEAYNMLKDKVNIVDIAVLMDRQQHVSLDYNYKYVLCKNDIVKYYLSKYREEKQSKICFSADISNPYKLLEILEQVGNDIVICKLHMDIVSIEEYEGEFINDIIKMSISKKFLLMEDRKFVDISYIVDKQYNKYKNWIDLVTVHGSCNCEVIKNLSGALLVANMSNNSFDFINECITMSNNYPDRVIGFITQYRVNHKNLICMTPGVSNKTDNINDQKYRNIEDIDTDIVIIGRAIYNSEDCSNSVKQFLNSK